MSKRISRIVDEVTKRWKETISANDRADVEAARKLILKQDRRSQIFEVETPEQFYIAQAVLRGRLSKTAAKEWCTKLKIDPSFISDLRRIGGVQQIVEGSSWFRRHATNIAANLIQDYVHDELGKRRARWSWRMLGSNAERETNEFLLCNLQNLYRLFVPGASSDPTMRAELSNLRAALNFNTNPIGRALLTRFDAVSGITEDIFTENYNPTAHSFDATHSEILARALNIKNPAVTINYEIFHCVPAALRFRRGYLLLTKMPKVHINAERALHNENGPAVAWPDASNFWYIDGHRLNELGEKIVMAPKLLTIEEISRIANEEERRIAIDRYGWGEYLEKSGGKVIDYRENWVDNTVEVLIAPPDNDAALVTSAGFRRRAEPLRMVLACRSTGRKYFIAVPERSSALLNVMGNSFANDEDINAKLPAPTCEMAQNWLAGGGVSKHLPYATHAFNVVGAS
jgi:hypothetical protein